MVWPLADFCLDMVIIINWIIAMLAYLFLSNFIESAAIRFNIRHATLQIDDYIACEMALSFK